MGGSKDLDCTRGPYKDWSHQRVPLMGRGDRFLQWDRQGRNPGPQKKTYLEPRMNQHRDLPLV